MALSKVGTNQIDTAATPTVAEATVTGDLTVDTNTLHVDATNNRVGIGTISPQKTVEVFNFADQQIRLRNGASATQSYDVGRVGATGLLKFYGNQSGYNGYIFDGADGERMRIDASGRVTMPNQTMFHANFTGTGQHSTSATNGHLVFNEVPVNVGGHYSTSNGRFTAPVTGNYWFAFNWQAHGGHNGSGYADLHRNGVGYYRYRAEGSGQNYDTRSMSGIVAMNANDYINIHFQDQRKLHQHFTAWSVYLIG